MIRRSHEFLWTGSGEVSHLSGDSDYSRGVVVAWSGEWCRAMTTKNNNEKLSPLERDTRMIQFISGVIKEGDTVVYGGNSYRIYPKEKVWEFRGPLVPEAHGRTVEVLESIGWRVRERRI